MGAAVGEQARRDPRLEGRGRRGAAHARRPGRASKLPRARVSSRRAAISSRNKISRAPAPRSRTPGRTRVSRARIATWRWDSTGRTSSTSWSVSRPRSRCDAVIAQLHAIETQCGRPRNAPKWASRTMDLDILLFGDRIEKTRRIHGAAPGSAEAAVHARADGGDRAGGDASRAHKTIGELWRSQFGCAVRDCR